MIYPQNFEQKIGFDLIRQLLKEKCLSTLGKEKVDEMAFSTDASMVNEWLNQVRDFRRLRSENDNFPMQYFFDVRESIKRIRIEGTHLEEEEVWDLRRSLETIANMVKYLNDAEEDITDPIAHMALVEYKYPSLQRLANEVVTFPAILRRIDSILDKLGKIKDSASMTLAGIRHDLEKTQGGISRTLYTILHAAQRDGLVDKDVAPTMRDGRLMIPVAPGLKRKINGIVHDESASGKTVFIEPAEVVEANNKVRELEAAERREIIRILTVFTDEIRPHIPEILGSYDFLAQIDLIQAKAAFAELTKGIEPGPEVHAIPYIDWINARHPLLQLSLEKQGKKVVPLDIVLIDEDFKWAAKNQQGGRLLIISGPNAGGKSVCLKTVGLLQYMLQCGMSIPVGDRSTCGMFHDIMIDIGDEQSIENDLSTYSSHLMNMKQMMRQANERTLLLIDEFGGGTEPTIGGAIAEAVLKQFWKKKTFGVITTHYQNLKHFADAHEGIVNGAMLYDRHLMQPLFLLQIGMPGSSFAVEIARKIGLPEEVITDASDIVGSDYINSDKYLQDIVRDKRYWQNKRQNIHQREKVMEETIARYERELQELHQERKDILRTAKSEAERLVQEANARIEGTIKGIKEAQAEKEETKKIRQELADFRKQLQEKEAQEKEDKITRKMDKLRERQQRKKDKKAEKGKTPVLSPEEQAALQAKRESEQLALLVEGATVKLKGQHTVGTIMEVHGKDATVAFGSIKTTVKLNRLEPAQAPSKQPDITQKATYLSEQTQDSMHDRKLNFKQDIDVRGMRGDEAIQAVTYFIDDAILIGVSRVRILHGTGTGILRTLIRQYLQSVAGVKDFHDEHVQFGGAGITVVDLE
ncbi:MAG: Smr/MutS family protein [Bacteroidaceae bacterium]|nr:Smr/MutS family protein [Bacteroidaceae bacterium]